MTTTERIGWRGSSAPGLMRYHYERFQGNETQIVRGHRGDVVSFDYHAQVDTGTILMELLDAALQPVWQCCVYRDGTERASVPLPTDGRYEVNVRGDHTGGAFDVRWSLEQAARS
jgi:hypothetical protein